MRTFTAPLYELGEFEEIRKLLKKPGAAALTGCVDSQKLHMIYGLSDGFWIKVIVTYSDLKAKELYEEYKFYDRNVMLYPAKDLIFFPGRVMPDIFRPGYFADTGFAVVGGFLPRL